MKRSTLWALALAMALLSPAAIADEVRATLAVAFDLDAEAADADQVVEAVAMEDDKDDYTIAAQPDSCRLLDITVVDTDLSVGTLTVTGTDCLGEALEAAFAFTAGDDTGVQTLTVTSGSASGAYFKTVTGVETDTMTGESDETFTLGYTTVPSNGWHVYGKRRPDGPLGERSVDVFDSYSENKRITTSGSSSTTVTSVSTDGPFTYVAVGDLLMIPVSGRVYERIVTARASANSITINSAINIPATGTAFGYKKAFFSTDPGDNLFIPVGSLDAGSFVWSVNANANTGGVVSSVECAIETAAGWSPIVEIDTDTVASGSTGNVVSSQDFRLTPYTHCRFGLSFGTNDDADAADEDIDVAFVATR
jgi:hypothetical protein